MDNDSLQDIAIQLGRIANTLRDIYGHMEARNPLGTLRIRKETYRDGIEIWVGEWTHGEEGEGTEGSKADILAWAAEKPAKYKMMLDNETGDWFDWKPGEER